tara:strand:- start:34 stop:327 length:294 start_codon:yes stop_codon:yes gene_type:complete
MELKSTSLTRLVKNKYKIDDEPIQMSDYEWRGTLNDSELFLIIKYNLGAWKVKYAETEYDLNNVDYIYVAQEISPMKYIVNKDKIETNNLITFLGWK